MEIKKYHVYFKGDILPGFELSRVKQNLADLYKNNPGVVQTLFSGKNMAIKKDADYSTAMNYFRAFEKAGARCHLAVVEDSTQKTGSPGLTTPEPADKPAPALEKDEKKPGRQQTQPDESKPQEKRGPSGTRIREPQPPETGKDTADSLNNRAVSLVDLDRQEEAIQLWTKALELQPHHPEATYNRGLIQWRSAGITDAHLLARMEEVRKSHGADGPANYLLGLVHLERGDSESALKVFKETIDRDTGINPEDLRAAITLARQQQPRSRKAIRIFEEHTNQVSSVAFGKSGRLALSGSWDNTVKLWEVESGKCLRTFTGHANSVTSAVLGTDARFVLSGGTDKTLRLWDVSTGRCLRIFTGHSGWVNAVALTHNNRYALSGGEDKKIKLWDVNSGLCLRTLKGHSWGVTSIAWSLDGRYILSGSYEEMPRLWELKTGQCLRSFKGHDRAVTSVAMSDDGRFGLSGSADRAIKLWRLETGECIRTFTGHQDEISSVSLTPDGQFALSGSADGTVRLWEVKTGRCLCTFTGHINKVSSAALGKEGKLGLSGGGGLPGQLLQTQDTTMRLWYTAARSTPNPAPLVLSGIRQTKCPKGY